MGSIYRKGRDGYFYYQTYVFNSKSGRKDKKIYQSLGTKDKGQAELLKKKLDIKYSEKKSSFYHIYKYPSITICLIAILTFLFYVYKKEEKDLLVPSNVIVIDDSTKRISNNVKVKLPDEKLNQFAIPLNDVNTIAKIHPNKDQKKVNVLKKPLSLTLDESMDTSKNNAGNYYMSQTNTQKSLEYEIFKEEQVSVSFNQLKIYANIKKRYSEENVLKLCEMIRSKNKNYQNIIICIYANYEERFVREDWMKKSNDELNKFWIAMYSYNKIEGAYFNPEPNKYLKG